MARLFITACIFCMLVQPLFSQSLYMPRDIQAAYKKGTRSADGKPGKNYWQNRGRYSINITAAPPSRTIQGTEDISYTNNSPDTLRNMVIKLFMNIHKAGVARNNGTNADYITPGITIDAFSVNGQQQEWNNYPFANTWQYIDLPVAVSPKDSVRLSFKWHYDMSLQSNREGMIDSTTFFLAYFYPRVAVYDDYNGWDFMDFTDQQEFYNDFNDYTVQVTVPKNYLVWGTGTLQNVNDVLQPEYASRFAASQKADQTIRIATFDDVKAKKVTTQNNTNTWKFTSSNVPDVAFALSDHFVWDAASVIVDNATGRRASVQAAYNDTAMDYHYMVQMCRHHLSSLSNNWPGVPYPYEKTTIFHGYAGMEYPMMANDETYADTLFSRFVAQHEIAHTYFPFYMGINETRYAFMDEGWATTFEYLQGIEDLGKEKATAFFKQFRVQGWINNPAADQDIPIITPADVLKNASYGNNAYGKPALGYLALKDMLGDALFKKCLHDFIKQWNGKHPLPWDMFNSFNTSSGKNLDWFWNNWYFSYYRIDLSVTNVAKANGGYTVTIKNIGGMAAPTDIHITYTDGSTQVVHQTPSIWQANQKEASVKITTAKTIQSLNLDGGIYMDADPSNNKWPGAAKAAF